MSDTPAETETKMGDDQLDDFENNQRIDDARAECGHRKVLRTVADVICRGDENVVVAAKRLRKEVDDWRESCIHAASDRDRAMGELKILRAAVAAGGVAT